MAAKMFSSHGKSKEMGKKCLRSLAYTTSRSLVHNFKIAIHNIIKGGPLHK